MTIPIQPGHTSPARWLGDIDKPHQRQQRSYRPGSSVVSQWAGAVAQRNLSWSVAQAPPGALRGRIRVEEVPLGLIDSAAPVEELQSLHGQGKNHLNGTEDSLTNSDCSEDFRRRFAPPLALLDRKIAQPLQQRLVSPAAPSGKSSSAVGSAQTTPPR